MNRSDLAELHYITPMDNVPSILERGILSKIKADRFKPKSVAMRELQDIRAKVRVPGARRLHEYANLYICARNLMLRKRSDLHLELCVLRIDTGVLDLPGAIVADGNAASDYTAFWPSPSGLGGVDRGLVFAEYWTDPNQIRQWEKGRVKCAEVLVPEKVDPAFIVGAYVSCEEARARLESRDIDLPIAIDGHLFFRN